MGEGAGTWLCLVTSLLRPPSIRGISGVFPSQGEARVAVKLSSRSVGRRKKERKVAQPHQVLKASIPSQVTRYLLYMGRGIS